MTKSTEIARFFKSSRKPFFKRLGKDLSRSGAEGYSKGTFIRKRKGGGWVLWRRN
jgi:hypothetical protein